MGVTAGIVEFADLNNASQEGPHLVRLKKACLRRRINGQLMLRYKAGGLTSFAGLELVGRFIRRMDFRAAIRWIARALPKSDFAFDCLPTLCYHANSAWQVFSILAFNLLRAMQAGIAERRSYESQTAGDPVVSDHSDPALRVHQPAGLLVQPGGRRILDVGNNPMIRKRFETIGSALAA